MTGPDVPHLLLIAARAPIAGETKTRLGAAVGMERAADLYRAFLTDLAARFHPSPSGAPADDSGYDVAWAYTPAGCDFDAVLADLGQPAPPPVRFVPQVGEGWGVRQANLLRWGHEHGYRRTVLIASDSPHLPREMPSAAFAALAEHEVVIGRVLDGGYFLIGLRGDHDVLSGVPMSTPDAAGALIERAQALGLRVAELAPTFDIDEEADLGRLLAALAPDAAAAPATWAALQRLGLAQPPDPARAEPPTEANPTGSSPIRSGAGAAAPPLPHPGGGAGG